MDKTKTLRPLKAMGTLQEDNWWPAKLGAPTTCGSSEHLRYAYFPARRRLAIERQGKTTVYDTADHQFRGVLQAGRAGAGLSFSTQKGRVNVDDLTVAE